MDGKCKHYLFFLSAEIAMLSRVSCFSNLLAHYTVSFVALAELTMRCLWIGSFQKSALPVKDWRRTHALLGNSITWQMVNEEWVIGKIIIIIRCRVGRLPLITDKHGETTPHLPLLIDYRQL